MSAEGGGARAADLPVGEIVLGDCVPVLSTFPDRSVDLVFADPPYNLSGRGMKWQGNTTGGDWYMVNEGWDKMARGDYTTFSRAWIGECRRLLRPGGSLFACATMHNLGVLLTTLESAELRLVNLVTWYKPNAMPNMTRRSFTHACEYLVWVTHGKGWTFDYEAVKRLNPEKTLDGQDKQMRDLWTLPVCQGRQRLRRADGRALHPTQKPEELVTRAVAACSAPGDVVLDPFMGSGTTAVVAERLGRRWVGVEREAAYRDAALGRITAARGGAG